MWFKDANPSAGHQSPLRLSAGKPSVALLVLFAVLATIGEPGVPYAGSGSAGAGSSETTGASRPLDRPRSSPGPQASRSGRSAAPTGGTEDPGVFGDRPGLPAELGPAEALPAVGLTPPAALPSVVPSAPAAPPERLIAHRGVTSPSAGPALEVPAVREWLRPLLARHARDAGVPPDLIMALAWRESSWRVGARSAKGAVGVMQLMPDTVEFTSRRLLGRSRPLDPRNAEANIKMGARFLAHLLDRFDGDVRLALVAYHQGVTSVLRRGPFTVSRRFAASVLALRGSFAT